MMVIGAPPGVSFDRCGSGASTNLFPTRSMRPRRDCALAKQISALFSQLAQSFRKIELYLTVIPGKARQPAENRLRCMPRLTVQQWAAVRLQGMYMGTLRGLSAAKRAQVKRIRAAKGIRAAIAAAERMEGQSGAGGRAAKA